MRLRAWTDVNGWFAPLQILPDSGHMALMEGDVDLAAIMARSGLLSADAADNSSHGAEQAHGGAEHGHRQRAAASVSHGIGSSTGVVNGAIAANTAGTARALDEHSAAGNGASSIAVPPTSPISNGALASNGAVLSAALPSANGHRSNTDSNGSSVDLAAAKTQQRERQQPSADLPTMSSSDSMALKGAEAASRPVDGVPGSSSVDGSSSMSLDDAGSSSRNDHNLEVNTLCLVQSTDTTSHTNLPTAACAVSSGVFA